jgi:hypothetical protein
VSGGVHYKSKETICKKSRHSCGQAEEAMNFYKSILEIFMPELRQQEERLRALQLGR